jgi:ABC-type transporter MlaC component
MWDVLEGRHITLWKKEKAKHIESVQTIADFRIESIGSNYRSRKRSLEQEIMDAFEEKIIRMYRSELQTATDNFETKIAEINARVSRADIHTALVANGIIEIKKG